MPVTDAHMRRAGGMLQRRGDEEERRAGISPGCLLGTDAIMRLAGEALRRRTGKGERTVGWMETAGGMETAR